MSILEEKTYSFIVKIWFEEEEDVTPAQIWRGHVTHIPSRKRVYFNNYDGVVRFIDQFIKSADSQNDDSDE
ncbi:MAG: hypothetical protein DWQ04_27205 [Chloroflexi bacterium]|nr:MAG: hypothetical protein DWQ04_27205 [Chloroflexota bacterium]